MDLHSGKPLDKPAFRFKTLTKHQAAAPEWVETAKWDDVPFSAEGLAVRVKVLHADQGMPGYVTAVPLGEVVLPLLSDDPPPPHPGKVAAALALEEAAERRRALRRAMAEDR